MGLMNPRPRGARTQADVNRERRAGEEQVRRLVSNIPKPAAPVAASGGIVGIANVETVRESLKYSPAGDFDLSLLQYQAPWDYGVPDLLPASDFVSVSGFNLHIEPGSYLISVRVDIGYPPGVAVREAIQVAVSNVKLSSGIFVGGWDDYLPTVTNVLTDVSGISRIVNVGPVVISDTGDSLRVATSGSGVGSLAGQPVVGVNGTPGLAWQIAKMG